MEVYLIEGTVLPERARIDHQFGLKFSHFGTGNSGSMTVSIICNKVMVWLETPIEWEVLDIRNLVKYSLLNELAVVGFLHGYTYELDVSRICNRERGIDAVFGIEVSCIALRNQNLDKTSLHIIIREKSVGEAGVFLHRCFQDLSMAMKSPEDTGFYCYRALEALRQHCIVKFSLPADKKGDQWRKLREIAKCDEVTTREIEAAAAHTRHGGVTPITDIELQNLLLNTWNVVEEYVRNV